MKMVKLLVFGMVAIWALPLFGFIPPDFKYREKEYIQKRQRDMAEYEQREIEYKKSLIDQRIRVEAAMKKPLWLPTSTDERVFEKKENSLVQRTVARTEDVPPEKAAESAVVPVQVATNKFIQKPPRKNIAENKVERVIDVRPSLVAEEEPQINHRFLVSVVLLILSGLAAGWIRYATRKLDE